MPTVTDPTSRLAAARIRAIRLRSGWSLADLSDRMTTRGGLTASPATLSRVETGARSVSLPELAAIATALGVTTEHLLRPGEVCEACGQEKPR
jgi:transcriptional regulator with XRE-family HTH domain